MSQSTRSDLLHRLETPSELSPDMRLGQLIANLAFMAKGPWDQVLWDIEDQGLLQAVDQMASSLRQRGRDVSKTSVA